MNDPITTTNRLPALVILVTLTWAGGTAWTRPSSEPAAPQDLTTATGLVPLDAAVADRNDLSTSLRVMQPGLQQPVDFARVYRLPGSEEQLFRAHGGLYAVFDESWYVRSSAGQVPMVPAGTRFFIGPPTRVSPPWQTDPMRVDMVHAPIVSLDRAEPRIETRIEAGLGHDLPPSEQEPMAWLPNEAAWSPAGRRTVLRPMAETPQLGRTIANDRGYRAQRIRELLLAINARDGP